MDEKITLEKLDILRERSNLSYQEAKELLELCDGDVVAALIELEHRPKESANETFFTGASEKKEVILERIKELVAEGKVTRIRVSHDGKVITELPVAVGALGAVFLPQLTLLAAILAMFRRCTIELVKKEEDASTEDDAHSEEVIAKMENDIDEKEEHTTEL